MDNLLILWDSATVKLGNYPEVLVCNPPPPPPPPPVLALLSASAVNEINIISWAKVHVTCDILHSALVRSYACPTTHHKSQARTPPV